jgi:hypothetical protein
MALCDDTSVYLAVLIKFTSLIVCPCPSNCSRATRQVVCNAEGLKAFARNAGEKAAVLAASALLAGVSYATR